VGYTGDVRSAAAQFLVGVTVCLLAVIAPLSYADPPDPLWIGGYWDDDDFDNVVVFHLNTLAVQPSPPPVTGLVATLVTNAECREPENISMPVPSPVGPRAPPAAPFPAF